MDVDAFDYDLPTELIAQTPLVDRTLSRLLALNKETGATSHLQFAQLLDLLHPGDVLVMNDTKVIPARLIGYKLDTGAKAEVLLLKSLGNDRWETLVRPGKKLKVGSVVGFGFAEVAADTGANVTEPLLKAIVEEAGEMGARTVRFYYAGIFNEILEQLGQMPLPPYIREQLTDKQRYQTVYAKHEGSAAAPTAGLHFTEEFLQQLRDKGVCTVYVTLHVGLGTFRPVSTSLVAEHRMHEEYYELPQETADAINKARRNGFRVVAVGTTTARTLETVAQICIGDNFKEGESSLELKGCSGWTDIFIYPGVSIRIVDVLLTNFHLPKSTLLMLISAMAGRESVLNAYREAVEQEYRFFSFGDAMLIY